MRPDCFAHRRRWAIDTTKIGCISLNPANPYLAVTAHLKRSLKLWDLRQLSSTPQDGTTAKIEASLLATHEHAKACSSAYFDPSGTRIVSTSYDDRIRCTLTTQFSHLSTAY